MKKRLISLLAVLALIVTLLPATAMAATFYMDLKAITSVDGKSISLDWDDDLNPPYSVQRRVAGSSSYTTVKSGIYNDEYVDASSKTMGKTYYYRIKDNAGNYSEEVPARTMAAPSYVKVTFSNGTAKLSWPAGKYCDGYIVTAVSAMDDFDEIDLDEMMDNMYIVEDTSFTYTNVSAEDMYVFMVMPIYQTSDGNLCIGEPMVGMEMPQLTVSKTDGKGKVSWGAVKGATKYYIYRGTTSGDLKYYDSTTSTSYTNSSVSGGTTYYYKVKAVKTVNGTDWTSDYSGVKSVKILSVPTLSISKSNGKITLSWNAVDGANKWQQFWSITLPQLSPTTFFVSVMLVIGCFKIYDTVAIMTGGGPGYETMTLDYFIYDKAFESGNQLGYACAVSMILLLVVLVITAIELRLSDKAEERWG